MQISDRIIIVSGYFLINGLSNCDWSYQFSSLIMKYSASYRDCTGAFVVKSTLILCS